MTVTIYSTPSCTYCEKAKKFFKENGIEYTEYDVRQDPEKRQEMMSLSGSMSVPVITIGDFMLKGFNEEILKMRLGL